MKKLKVLMAGNSPSVRGGITSVITQLLGHDWSSEGISVDLIPTYDSSGSIKKITYFSKAYIQIRRYIKKEKPDVVYMHMSYRGSFVRKSLLHRLCKKYGIPDIIHLHGSEFKKWYDESGASRQGEIRRLLREATVFIVLGSSWKSVIKEIEPRANTIAVENAVHIPEKTASWNEDRFQVLFMGVLIERKGVFDLLKAVKLLKERGRAKRLRVVIAGSGEMEESLRAQADKSGISDIVYFNGWTEGEEKKRLYAESQLLVLPSYNEGLPVAVLEAISYALPVVASDVGDISSAVRDGENGYLVEPGDIPAIAGCIDKIASERAVFDEMSENSRRIAKERFSDEGYFRKIADCCRAAAERQGPAGP